ncbi:Imm1 family immunity protein [Kribbella sp. NPDC004138]
MCSSSASRGLASCCTRSPHEPVGSVWSRRSQPLTCRRSLHTHRSRHLRFLSESSSPLWTARPRTSIDRLARDAEASPSCASRSTIPTAPRSEPTYVPSRTDENAAARSRRPNAGHPEDFALDSEDSLDVLRAAVKDFLYGGGQRPTGVEWRAWPRTSAESDLATPDLASTLR